MLAADAENSLYNILPTPVSLVKSRGCEQASLSLVHRIVAMLSGPASRELAIRALSASMVSPNVKLWKCVGQRLIRAHSQSVIRGSPDSRNLTRCHDLVYVFNTSCGV